MIDLHTHTSCSDGDFSPTDLIILAANYGLTSLSITDHDTIKAYESDIVSFAKQQDVFLIPGIELSTIDTDSNQRIHVVGLNIDVNDDNLNSLCTKLYRSRQKAVFAIKDKLQECGIVLRSDDLLKSNYIITKSQIAKDIVSNPANREFLLNIYGDIPFHSTIIEDYLAKGKPAFVSNPDKLSTNEAVMVIQQAKGKAFCAHPSFNVMHGFDLDSMEQLILRNKFDGLETINIQYNKQNGDTKFDMVKEFTDLAHRNDLLTSGGSDFHSDDRSLWGNHSNLGLSNESYQLTERQLAEIIAT
jgi:predicted metal-dependent phosphoesterase TrpH